MTLKLFISLVFLSCLLCIKSEHRKLIPKCSNSCFNSLRSTNCFCDSKCSLIYNDCCLDAPYRSFRVNNKRLHNIHCTFVHGENKDFWMVDTCKDTWTGNAYIKNKCISSVPSVIETNNIIGALPVTSPKEEVTYKNYYCGLCNDENPEDLIEWKVKALCANKDIKPDDVLQNLTYVEDKLQWGVWKTNTDGNSEFHECYLMYQRPPGVTSGIRQCISNMVSTCPSSWRNIATRRKCKSYVDPIKWPEGPLYKNIDCAICHNKTVEDFRCYYDKTRYSSNAVLNLAMPVDISATGQWL